MQPSDIANAMAQAVMEFDKTRPNHLQDIRFVIFQKTMEKDFHSALKKQANKSKGGTMKKLVESVKGKKTIAYFLASFSRLLC